MGPDETSTSADRSSRFNAVSEDGQPVPRSHRRSQGRDRAPRGGMEESEKAKAVEEGLAVDDFTTSECRCGRTKLLRGRLQYYRYPHIKRSDNYKIQDC